MKITKRHTNRAAQSMVALCCAAGLALGQEAGQPQPLAVPRQFIAVDGPSGYADTFYDTQPINARCGGQCSGCDAPGCGGGGGFFAGGEYLLIKPTFSEAVAFARGAAGPASLQTAAEALDFDYDDSFRIFAGYRAGSGDGELRLSYWSLEADTAVGTGTPGPGEFIIDPFGNLFGIDPTGGAAPFYQPTGDSINTRASVEMDVFDIDFKTSVGLRNRTWNLDVLAGVRIAEVNQFYESVIRDAAGVVLAGGDYSVNFTGAGPRLGGGLSRSFGQDGQFNLHMNGAGSLLLGDYDVVFGASAGPFQGGQSEQMTRLIPVLDMEVGGAWQCCECVTVGGGWMVQGWGDLGTSGGSFSGLFTGADDANIMSFNGMFLRAEVAF